MLRRQSGLNASTRQSAKSRSTTARRSRISEAAGRRSVSHPYLSQSLKLIRAPDHEQLGALQDPGHEMMALRQPFRELGRAVQGRIHLSSQMALDRSETLDQLPQAHVSDDEKIHITGGSLPAGCQRTEHKGKPDPILQRRHGFLQHTDKASSLDRQPAELGIDG